MKRFSLFFLFCGITGSVLLADELKPPMPVPPEDSPDLMPPPMDLNQLTPLPLPGNPKAEPAKKDVPASPAGSDKKAQTDAALKALNESPSTANPKALVPTATPAKLSENKKAIAPAATPTMVKVSAPAAEKPAAPAPSLGLFADYFPTAKGAQWTYEYLKAEAGSKSKKTRTVESLGQEAASNGGVNATLQVTEDGQATQEKYSLRDNQVEHAATGDQVYTGDFTFKLPPPGGTAAWSVTEPNGTVHKSKASFGKAQVYHKTYPDCVIVTEKVIKGGKPANTVIYYYAKGIGLVAVEVYSPKFKLLQTNSIALVSGPGN